jgi:hypothetical protein
MQAHPFYQALHQSVRDTLPRLRTYLAERYITVKKIKVPSKEPLRYLGPDSCTMCDPPHIIEDGLMPPSNGKITGFGSSQL